MRMSYLEAGRLGLEEEMHRDPTVWAVGEDLGRGGVFGQYRGLVDIFGAERICDAPISEAAILGASVGAASASGGRAGAPAENRAMSQERNNATASLLRSSGWVVR